MCWYAPLLAADETDVYCVWPWVRQTFTLDHPAPPVRYRITTKNTQRLYERRDAMQKWADYLGTLE